LCPLVWLVIVVIVIGLGVYVTHGAGRFALLVAAGYVLAVLWLLNNI
jgi:hypothetical protein